MRAVETSTLSAIGSKNLPRLVTSLYFRAMYPSRKSVNAASTKIIAEIKRKIAGFYIANDGGRERAYVF